MCLALLLLGGGLAGASAASNSRGSLDEPPYYDGKAKKSLRPAAHLPVRFRGQPGVTEPSPANSKLLAAVMDSLQAELVSLGMSVTLSADLDGQKGPDVSFGRRRGGVLPDGTPRSLEEIDPSEHHLMAFLVEDPSKKWKERVRLAAGDSVVSILSIQLGFSDYWARKQDRRGNKLIELGHRRSMSVPWLESLDEPVQVLQLTGAVVNAEGKVVRLGAEGLFARRPGMSAAAAGPNELLTEDELEALTYQRADGGGPVWRKALRELVTRLLRTEAEEEEAEEEEEEQARRTSGK